MRNRWNRRELLRGMGWLLVPAALDAAQPFWNRKPPSEWSSEEITQLLTRSPWSHETNLDFEAIEGGHVELPAPTGAPPQPGDHSTTLMSTDAPAGSLRRTPVVVRWESAQPLRDTLQIPPLQAFEDRYVIGVSNIPADVMKRRKRDMSMEAPLLSDFLAELQGAATLQVSGRDPVGAGLVKRVAGSENNYMFGFSRDLLPIGGAEKEIQFVLHTALVSVRAKFEPKTMIYRGKIAL